MKNEKEKEKKKKEKRKKIKKKKEKKEKKGTVFLFRTGRTGRRRLRDGRIIGEAFDVKAHQIWKTFHQMRDRFIRSVGERENQSLKRFYRRQLVHAFR